MDPGPPTAIAVATPPILPTPTVVPIAILKASKDDTIPAPLLSLSKILPKASFSE